MNEPKTVLTFANGSQITFVESAQSEPYQSSDPAGENVWYQTMTYVEKLNDQFEAAQVAIDDARLTVRGRAMAHAELVRWYDREMKTAIDLDAQDAQDAEDAEDRKEVTD